MTQPTLPGLYQTVPFDQYLQWPYLSQSTIKAGRHSMAHLRAALDEEKGEPTDAMTLGSALHVAFLEPELMAERVVVWKGGRRFGATWDAFQHDNQGKHILTEGMNHNLVGMVRSLRKHPEIRRWLGKIEATEVSAIGEIDGETVKARGDALTADPLIDLKSIADGDPRKVRRTAHDLWYYGQGAIHRHLLNRERFILATVESSSPYDVALFEFDERYLQLGMVEAKCIIAGYQSCNKSGVWPGRSDQIESLDIPDWLESQLHPLHI